MATGFKIDNVDLEDMLEITRDNPNYSGGVVDVTSGRPSPFEGSGLTQSNPELTPPLQKFFNDVLFLDSGLNISDDFPSVSGDLTKKGYRPRINPFIRKTVFEKDGSGTRRHYVIKRREDRLQVYDSTDPSFPYVNSYNLIKEILPSEFPNGVIPHYLYFLISAGGGGGMGGGWNDGIGGGGGAFSLGMMGLTNSYGANPSESDFIFSISKGGKGGGGKWSSGLGYEGEDGTPSYVIFHGEYVNNLNAGESIKTGSIISGGGANIVYSSPYLSYAPILVARKGGDVREGINVNETVFLEQYSHVIPARGSRTDGGHSIGAGGGENQAGSKGSGGGGGDGGGNIFNSGDRGGAGGNGYLALYY